MTAATQNRNTRQRAGLARGYPIAAGVHAYAGAIAVLNASGYCAPATTATGLVPLGRFAEEYDNTGGANGAATIEVERGIFQYANSASADEITAADIGKKCYLVDDQTVAKTNGTNTRSIAGIVDGVDALGVWVLIDPTSGALL
ncbi:MAG: hypothetical protein ACOY42_02050 [Pseudomonadota bacterium]